MHPFDRWLFARTLLAVASAVTVTAVVAAATDEATATFGMRLARLSAFVPFAAAVGPLAVTAHATIRGEIRALSALGVAPWRAARGGAWAALLAGVVGMGCLLSPWADASSLFPAVRVPASWTVAADASRATAPGVAIDGGGKLTLRPDVPADAPKVLPGAWAAVPCLGLIAAIVPAWSVTPMIAVLRVSSMSATAFAAVVLLHGIAAGRLSASLGIVGALPLLLAVLWARRRS